jgi:ligand-binding sensor domain-containing protein
MLNKRFALILFHVCILISTSFAQTYRVQTFNVDEGLPSSFVYRVVPDSKGFMWVLTDKGMARFDGKNFQLITNDVGKSGNSAFSAGEDSHQRLWLYSSLRYFIYFDLKDNRFYTIPNPAVDAKKPGFFGYIFENKEGGLDFYNVNKIVYSLDKNLKFIGSKECPTGLLIQRNYPHIDTTRIFYLKKKPIDTVVELTTLQNIPLPSSIMMFPSGYMNSVSLQKNHLFYRKGAYLVSYSEGKTIEKKISDLTADKENIDFRISGTGKPHLLFVRTTKESFIVDAALNRVKEYDFLNQYSVNTIYFDNRDNLWICTENKGLILCTPPPLKAPPKTIFQNMAIEVVAVDKKGNVFVGNDIGEIYYAEKGVEKKLNILNAPRLNVRFLQFTKKGELFASWRELPHTLIQPQIISDRPIKTFYDETLKQLKMAEWKNINVSYAKNQLTIVKAVEVKTLAENSMGDLYYVAGADMWRLRSTEKGWESKLLYNTRAYDMSNDVENNVWLARYDGLWQVKEDKLDSLNDLKKAFPLLTRPVFYMKVDSKKNFWFAHDDFNFYCLNPQKKTLEKISELKNDIVSNISIDAQNRVWVATNNGVGVIEVTSENPFTYRFLRINRAHGLLSQDTHKTVVDDENLYVATSKGLTIFELKELFNPQKDATHLRPLAIKSLRVNGLDTILRGYYDLPYDKNNIDIDFTCISFSENNPLQYEYRLVRSEGLDTAWRRIQEPHIELSYLPNGSYKLDIRALYDNEVVSTLNESIQINIKRPFWRTPLFILTVLSIIGIGILFFYRHNITKIKKEETEKAAVTKRIATLEMQALQAQMNPHFIFNALTAIQNSIWNQDVKTANSFLARFSMLMRQFLEFSRQKFVTVEDEKSLIENYIELEKMRFPNRFNVVVTMDDNLDPLTEIPSSMIQPFVENAINHGLLYKKEKGNLMVSFLNNGNNGVTCVVEDDGVGRAKAGEIQHNSQRTHRSQATQIIKEKTELLRQTADIDVVIDIIDKNKEGSTESGTKVIIHIYINEKQVNK